MIFVDLLQDTRIGKHLVHMLLHYIYGTAYVAIQNKKETTLTRVKNSMCNECCISNTTYEFRT